MSEPPGPAPGAGAAPGRRAETRYADPLDLVWLETARRLGMRVARSGEVYASWDGAGTLTLSTPEGFDPDDSVAQMVFHEVCHALVEGPAARGRADWGLDNTGDHDRVREHACHRLQAALADRHGLRVLLAVTTDERAYYDALPSDPLAPGDDPAIRPAREGWERARHGPWAEAIEEALSATARVAAAVRGFADAGSLWSRSAPLHPLGAPLRARRAGGTGGAPLEAAETCGTCAWRFDGGPGRVVPRCRQGTAPGTRRAARVDPAWPACDRWEPALDDASCGACGACCREGFHLVTLGPREPLALRRPDWVVRDRHGLHLPRPGGRCVALAGDGAPGAPYRCRAYADRPRACREFDVGGWNCLEARRRAGLSGRALGG